MVDLYFVVKAGLGYLSRGSRLVQSSPPQVTGGLLRCKAELTKAGVVVRVPGLPWRMPWDPYYCSRLSPVSKSTREKRRREQWWGLVLSVGEL